MTDAIEVARLQAVEVACQQLAQPGVYLTKTRLRAALATTVPAPDVIDPVTPFVEDAV